MAKELKKESTKKKSTSKKNKKILTDDFDVGDIVSSLAEKFEIELMSDDSEDRTPYYIAFRNKALQLITGGIPGGRISEIIGDSQCGKSYEIYELGAEVIGMGGAFLLHDPENAYSPIYGRRVGLQGSKRFSYSNEMKLEMVFNLSRQFVLKVREKNTKCPILMAVDTYSPLLTINSVKEIEEVLKTQGEKALKGYKAAKKNNMFNDLLGEFCTFLRDQDATLVILSQLKRKIGVVFGDDKTSNADNIMRYYATLRIRGTLGSKIIKKTKINGKEVKRKIGVISHWETIKNRNVSPFRQCSVKILYKEGIDRISGLQELMINEGIVEGVEGKPKKISYDGKITTIKKLLESNPELFEKLPE